MNRRMVVVASALAGLAIFSGVAISQDKYTLRVPDGLAFADFKGYEDWQLISSAKTDDRMKVILGNPTIIAAFDDQKRTLHDRICNTRVVKI